jgi:hypothetical protein
LLAVCNIIKHTLGPKPALALPSLAGVSAELADDALALPRAGVIAALSPAALRLLGVLMLLLLPPAGTSSALLVALRLVGVGGCAPAVKQDCKAIEKNYLSMLQSLQDH